MKYTLLAILLLPITSFANITEKEISEDKAFLENETPTKIQRYILSPVKTTIPKIQRRIGNIFENAELPLRATSAFLQGNFKKSAKETGKLLIDTTIGIGGIFRPSASVKEVQ
jgi:ABC-type transporter lipoprotein component MlaA